MKTSTPSEVEELAARLAHVYWLGGSPCSGKSSIADLIGNAHGLQVYHIDAMLGEHAGRVTEEAQPTLHKWLNTGWNELWMQSADVLLEEAVTAYSEHLELVLEDLLSLSPEPLLVEGNPLMPDEIAPLLSDGSRALWLLTDESLLRARYAERPGTRMILSECNDPDRAWNNWMTRDAAFARLVAGRAERLDLPLMWMDGTHSVEANAERVAQRLGLQERAMGRGKRR